MLSLILLGEAAGLAKYVKEIELCIQLWLRRAFNRLSRKQKITQINSYV